MSQILAAYLSPADKASGPVESCPGDLNQTLDEELGAIFKRWYPDMDIVVEEMPAAA